MRIEIKGDGVRVALRDAAVAQTRALGEGIAAETDAQGQLVAVTIAGAAVTAALAGAGAAAPGAPQAPASPPPAPPAPLPRTLTLAERAALGPLTWAPEAEAAMARVPFFQRGARRRAVVELARARGLTEVTPALVAEAGGR